MIKILIKTSSRYPVERQRIKKNVKNLLINAGLEDNFEVGVNFIGDRKIKSLNKEYRQINQVTDVLSFPLSEKAPDEILYLGDVVISYPQARKQAAENNLTVDDEIDRLVKHGILSLMGKHD